MQRSHLFIDNQNEVLVDLPSGKLSKTNSRKAIRPQKQLCCILYSMRKLAYFNDPDIKQSPLYQAFRRMKELLANFRGDYAELLEGYTELCHKLNINIDRVILNNKSYSEIHKRQINIKCYILYEALIRQRLFPLFNIQESGWHPKDGLDGLKESLRKHGAHVFLGKFGTWCHIGKDNSLVSFFRENSHNREMYGFKKGSYAGENASWIHAVVVDQVKKIDGKEMVCFRDPYDSSSESRRERIYMISYESFIQRLTNQQAQHYAKNQCQFTDKFGIVSI